MLAVGILGPMTAEYYVAAVMLLLGQLYMSLGAKTSVYEVSIAGVVIMMCSAVRVFFHLLSSRQAFTAGKLSAILATILIGTATSFSFVSESIICIVTFLAASELQLIMLAKASLVIDERQAGDRLMNFSESACQICIGLIWLIWSITSRHWWFILLQAPSLLGGISHLVLRLWAESTGNGWIGLDKIPTPQESRLLHQLHGINKKMDSLEQID